MQYLMTLGQYLLGQNNQTIMLQRPRAADTLGSDQHTVNPLLANSRIVSCYWQTIISILLVE